MNCVEPNGTFATFNQVPLPLTDDLVNITFALPPKTSIAGAAVLRNELSMKAAV
ncbi:hypothetical protein D9M71_714410 [compost metagenome]